MDDSPRVEPTVIDARAGLTPDVLADLRQARELFLARKSDEIGVFGYWIEQPPRAARLVVLLLKNRDPPEGSTSTGAAVSEEPIIVRLARAGPGWERALRLLQPGDVVGLRWMGSQAALLVEPPAPSISFSFMRSVDRRPGEPEIRLSVSVYPDWPRKNR
jgi:hypothetical protein